MLSKLKPPYQNIFKQRLLDYINYTYMQEKCSQVEASTAKWQARRSAGVGSGAPAMMDTTFDISHAFSFFCFEFLFFVYGCLWL